MSKQLYSLSLPCPKPMSPYTFFSKLIFSSDSSFIYPFSLPSFFHYTLMKKERKRQRPEEKEEEERKIKIMEVEVVDALAAAATVAAAAAVEEEEELWGMRLKAGDDVVEELMSWSTVWLPSCWDVEFVEKNYGVLFNDVAWDDDLWNLNTSSTQLPPLDNNITQDRSRQT